MASIIAEQSTNRTINSVKEEEWNVKVHNETAPWPIGAPGKRASVSSFGYGGTNGHVIIESVKTLYPWYHHGAVKDEAEYDHSTARPLLLCFSAHDKPTLERNVKAIGDVAHKYFPSDLAHTLNTRRTRFGQRAFTVIKQGQESKAFAETALKYGSTDKASPRVGYLFTGQGAQWVGMGASAMHTFSSFRETIRNLDRVLGGLENKPSWSIEKVLLGESHTDQLSDAELAQPLCTAIQIAIVDLFEQWGIEPSVAVGHSSGEIGAAYASGLISAPEAMLAAFFRGYAVKHHTSSGTMLAVGVGAEEVAQYLPESSDEVVIACENSPNSVTLSGNVEAVLDVKKTLDAQGVFARELKTGKAYHSPHMVPVSVVYNEMLSKATERLSSDDLAWQREPSRMVSSVTGEEISSGHLGPSYWSDNLRNRVRFSSAVAAIGKAEGLDGGFCFVEIGPHSALAGPFKQICKAEKLDRFNYIASLVRNNDDTSQLLSSAGSLFVKDYPVDLEAVNSIELSDRAMTPSLKRNKPSLLVDLPPYQWNYERTYWTEPRPSAQQRHLTHARHDLLGSKISGLSDRSAVWRNVLRHRDVPWLKDHTLGNAAIFPAAGYMALAIEAVRQIHETNDVPFEGVTLRDINIKTALVIPESDDGVEIQLHLQKVVDTSSKGSWQMFAVESLTDGRWTTHCDGMIGANINVEKTEKDYESPVKQSKLTQRVPGKRWYEAFHRVGFDYMESFQQLQRVKSDRKYHEAAAEIPVRNDSGKVQGESRYMLHPATVDACLQLIIISIHSGMHKEMPWGVVPTKVNEVNFWFPQGDLGTMGNAVAWTDSLEARQFNTHTKLMGESGNLIMDIKGLRCVAYEAAVPPTASNVAAPEPYMQNSWKPDIETLSPAELTQYCEGSVPKLVELLDHKHGLMHVLLLGRPGQSELDALKQGLSANASIAIGYSGSEELDAHESDDESDSRVSTFLIPEKAGDWAGLSLSSPDLIVAQEHAVQAESRQETLSGLKGITGERGWMVLSASQARSTELANDVSSYEWSVSHVQLSSEKEILLCDAAPHMNGAPAESSNVTVLRTDSDSGPSDELLGVLKASGVNVNVKLIQDFNAETDQQVVLSDKTHEILADATEDSFEALKTVLCAPVNILWLIKGVKEGSSIAGGMAEGFLRVIRSEQAAAKISLLDCDSGEQVDKIGQAILHALKKSAPKDAGQDTEFWLHNGIVQVGRVIGNSTLNSRVQGSTSPPETKQLTEGSPLAGSIEEGQVVFHPDVAQEASELGDGEVAIQVKYSEPSRSAGANVLVLGTVQRTGANVGENVVGKDVVAYATASFATVVQTSIWAPAPPNLASADVLASLSPLCPAANASILTAKTQGEESLLLLPAPQQVTAAYVRLSQALNWKLTVVANDEEEKQAYTSKFGLTSESVLAAADVKTILDLVQTPTASAPSVVVAHDFSTLSKEVWRSIKPLGRFVLNEASLEGSLDALPFSRGASFLTSRVSDLARQDLKAARELLRIIVSLVTEHQSELLTKATAHDIGALQIAEAIQADGAVVAYDYNKSSIQVEPQQGAQRFSPDATYLLVGCLGGLGRSLTTWMVERGAKHFAFISRSGADKPEAAEVIKGIEETNASAEVFRADASNERDVRKVVNAVMAKRPIRGVVHAAMVLKDGIFEKMSAADFQAAIVPKVKGAQSLDKALEGIDLDFFVMTSSISATLGNPGQTNYSAANSFLDSLAWQRNLRRQAATSLVLPMVLDVGVVSENENIETSLSRKGMYGIDEQEMLRGFETAMSVPSVSPDQPAPNMGNSQVILGLEPSELAKAIASSETVDAYWYNDARLARIRAEVERAAESAGGSEKGGDFKKTLKSALAESVDAAVDAIAQHVMKRASGILMVPAESFEMEGASIASYGLDSMIGAELRTWLFKEFGLDMPFQQLLSGGLTFKKLSVTIGESMGVLPKAE